MLRYHTFISALFLFTVVGCGGTDNGQTSAPQIAPDSPNTPDASPTTWQPGVFSPSDDFYQVCADPTKAYDQTTAVQGTYVDENNWMRSFVNETYLWYDEVEDRDPACCTTPEYFGLMKTFETTASGNPKDKFSHSVSTKEYLDSQRGVELGYGFRIARTTEGFLIILYVDPRSPADNAGLRRGMVISEVDGIPVASISDEQLLSALFPSEPERHEFTISTLGGSETRSVAVRATEVVTTPVQRTILVVERTGHRIGYMLFNSHIPVAEAGLIEAIGYFDFNNIDDMVLDLRYNLGGLVSIASELAFMIAGSRVTQNAIFEKFITNGKLPSEEAIPFYNASSGGFPLPSLGLSRVFVLTGPRTCSASEGIINGLRGVDIEVVLIGATTCGKPYAQVPEDNCGTTYNVIQYRGVNDKGFGDYADGFQPTCPGGDDVRYPLGDPEEERLKGALYYMELGECPTSQRASISSGESGSAAKASPDQDQPEPPAFTEIWPPAMPLRILD